MFTVDHTLDTNTRRIAVVGDWHTDIDWMLSIVEQLNNAGVKHILHVGDFGYGLYESPEAEESAMARLSSKLEEYGMNIGVTLGNHDNWVRFNALTPGENGLCEVWKNIHLMPRGYRFSINGTTFVSLGGAASINYHDLTEGIDWWREETVTMGDLYRLGGEHANVMITHDAPEETQALFGRKTKLEQNWPVEAYQYSNSSQRAISAAISQVRPEFLFHGHYHVDYLSTEEVDGHVYQSVGLNMNGRANNVMLFILEDRTLNWL